jgi:RNA polymerase sigma-70 factor (ECF subfamily)
MDCRESALGALPMLRQAQEAPASAVEPCRTQARGRLGPDHASEDGVLVRQAGAGDATAFARLYDRYARMVHGLLLARVGPYLGRDDVDDLVQDVFLTAWRRLGALRDPAAFGGWLATIARSRAADFHRRHRSVEQLPDHLAAPDTAPALDARAVLAAIQSLPRAYRETLVLRLVEGLTGPEIAAQTGLTSASVRVNLHRGMKLLRERLAR